MSLIYSLSAIKFAEIPQSNLDERIDRIHESFRKTYPNKFRDIADQVSVTIDHKNENNIETKVTKAISYSFVAADKSEGIILTSSRLIFHTTNFTTTNEFIDKAIAALKLISQIIDITHFGNISARYINNFNLIEDDKFDGLLATQYIADKVNCMPARGGCHMESIYTDSPVVLILRSGVRINTQILPPELLETAVKQLGFDSSLIAVLAFLDIDCIYEMNGKLENFEIEKVKSNLEKVCKKASVFYKEIQKRGDSV